MHCLYGIKGDDISGKEKLVEHKFYNNFKALEYKHIIKWTQDFLCRIILLGKVTRNSKS